MDGHDNKEQNIGTGIPQRSPVSPILFLVYISRVFEKVTESCPEIIFLLFVDNLSFIASRHSVRELAKILGQVAMVVLNWRKSNVFTRDLAKTEAVLFSKSHRQRLNKRIAKVNLKLGPKR